jgi:hypothetical protein
VTIVPVGTSVTIIGDHDGVSAAAYRLFDGATQIAEIPYSALVRTSFATGACSGTWALGTNGAIMRNGAPHPTGSVANHIVCQNGTAVWVLGVDGIWYQLVSGAWQARTAAPTGTVVSLLGGEVRFTNVVLKTAGTHRIGVVTLGPSGAVSPPSEIDVDVRVPGPPMVSPTNVRVILQ